MAAKNSSNQQTEITVSELNSEMEQQEIVTIFEKFGKIVNINIQKNNENKSCIAIIQYENDTNANNAVSKMDGQTINGNTIKVKKTASQNNGADDSIFYKVKRASNDDDDAEDDDEFDDDGDSDDDSDSDDDDDSDSDDDDD